MPILFPPNSSPVPLPFPLQLHPERNPFLSMPRSSFPAGISSYFYIRRCHKKFAGMYNKNVPRHQTTSSRPRLRKAPIHSSLVRCMFTTKQNTIITASIMKLTNHLHGNWITRKHSFQNIVRISMIDFGFICGVIMGIKRFRCTLHMTTVTKLQC